jgi:predicted DNA-binding transcriptional regulator YafY
MLALSSPRMHPLERLINLVALLLEARRPLSFDEIREALPAYDQADAASAKRMFERDKDTLREAGIPVELQSTDIWEVEQGYRIPKERYYLPEIEFTPEEVWALFVAAHAPGEDGEAERAFWKLATGVDTSVVAAIAERTVAPGLDASGPNLGSVADALARGRRIRFRYRPAQGRAGPRGVDPFALLFRRGHWYLVGRDAAKAEIRAYRLSRLTGPVRDAGPAEGPPPGFQATQHVQAGPWGLGEPEAAARVAFSPKVAAWVVPATTGARVLRTRDDGWVEVEVPASRTEPFVSWVLSFGPDARVEAPRAVRDEVVGRLESVLADG